VAMVHFCLKPIDVPFVVANFYVVAANVYL